MFRLARRAVWSWPKKPYSGASVLRMPSSAAYAHGLPATIISWHIHFSPIFFGTHGREHNLALPERKNSVRLRHLAHAPLPSCDGCEGRVSNSAEPRPQKGCAQNTRKAKRA